MRWDGYVGPVTNNDIHAAFRAQLDAAVAAQQSTAPTTPNVASGPSSLPPRATTEGPAAKKAGKGKGKGKGKSVPRNTASSPQDTRAGSMLIAPSQNEVPPTADKTRDLRIGPDGRRISKDGIGTTVAQFEMLDPSRTLLWRILEVAKMVRRIGLCLRSRLLTMRYSAIAAAPCPRPASV